MSIVEQKTIAIFGSTGSLGRTFLDRALEQGYSVRTLVRTPEKLGTAKWKVDFIQGDVFDMDCVAKTLSGCSALVSTVAPTGDPIDPHRYEQLMQDIVGQLEEAGIQRYVHVGGAVHPGGENENWTVGRRILRLFLNIVWKPGLIAKMLEWQALKGSSLDWTLVRPPRITKGDSERRNVRADEKNLASTKINVCDLADFMLDQLVSDHWVRKAPLVANA